MEQWKTFLEYDSQRGHQAYQVSTEGRVRNLTTGKILKPSYNRGYQHILVNHKVHPTSFQVHRLVAEMFIPNPENKPQVDHINGIRDDNRIENLRWATHKENQNNPHLKRRLKEAWRRGSQEKPYKKSELVLLLEKIVPL